MEVTLELKFIEFKSNDPTIKKVLKAYQEEGWVVECLSAKYSKKKRFRLKRLGNEAV